MDEIKQYSKEWFVTNKSKTQAAAIKKLKKSYDREMLDYGNFKEETLLGTKKEVKSKVAQLAKSTEIDDILENFVIEKAGGVDNLFNIIDADGDGKITHEEVMAIAAADTKVDVAELENKLDTNFTAKDLKVVYENAMAADGATVETDGSKTRYTFKDKSTTEIQKDSAGKVVSKYMEQTSKNGEKTGVEYDYASKTKTSTIIDKNGNVRYENIDAPGKVNDKEIKTEYNAQGKKTKVTTDTAGRTITETYDLQKGIKSTKTVLKYNSDGKIDDTKQRTIGDCWLLSGVNAMRDIPKGAKALDDAITQNADGSVTVTLKGVKKSYTYTPEQIGANEYSDPNKKYSTGDIDMNLLEMAIGDYRRELVVQAGENKTGAIAKATVEDPLKSGYLEEAVQYLTGKKVEYSYDKPDKFLKNKEKKQDRYATMAYFKEADPSVDKDIVNKHAYQVKKVTKDTVYVVNPWDSSIEVAYPRDKFKENVKSMVQIDFK